MKGLLLLIAILFCCNTNYACELQPGDVFITRNAGGEDINTSPGWYNHVAIYTGNDHVVEAQEFEGVITTPLKTFWERYPYIVVMRPVGMDETRRKVLVKTAKGLVGRPYNKYASLPFWTFDMRNNGESCVSVVRRCFEEALGYDPGWRLPDGVAEDNGFNLKMIGYKELEEGVPIP